jgi:hypothetical protein
MAVRSDDRQAGDRHRMAPSGISMVLDVEDPSWTTRASAGFKGNSRPHSNHKSTSSWFTPSGLRFCSCSSCWRMIADALCISNVTAHPTSEWTARQIVEAFPFDSAPKYLLRDRDRIYGQEFRKQVAKPLQHRTSNRDRYRPYRLRSRRRRKTFRIFRLAWRNCLESKPGLLLEPR